MAKDKKGISAVFLDRDGTLNEDGGFANDPNHARLLPHVASAIRELNERGLPVFVISNQSGIARGLHTEEDTRRFNAALATQLEAEGAHVDGWYFCPHHPSEGTNAYRMECECRKPKAGMLLQAAREHAFDVSRTVLVGDSRTDIEAGHTVNARTVLVLSGHGASHHASWSESFKPSYVAADLSEATKWILGLKA